MEFRRSVELLKAYLKKTGMKTLVLGISGGQDSTLAGKMSQTAPEELRAETGDADYKFVAMRCHTTPKLMSKMPFDSIAWQQADQQFV